jgi:cytochrome P450
LRDVVLTLLKTLWCLASHPDVQDKLRADLGALMLANARPTYTQLKTVAYLECVIKEALRLFPPIPTSFRQAAEDDWVDGVFVPKGTLLYIGIRVLNTWEEYWGADAGAFRPERWAAGAKHPPHRGADEFAFQTFYAGPHSCLGKTMAMMEMSSAISSVVCFLSRDARLIGPRRVLIHNFSFSLAYPGQQARPTTGVTMSECTWLY